MIQAEFEFLELNKGGSSPVSPPLPTPLPAQLFFVPLTGDNTFNLEALVYPYRLLKTMFTRYVHRSNHTLPTIGIIIVSELSIMSTAVTHPVYNVTHVAPEI